VLRRLIPSLAVTAAVVLACPSPSAAEEFRVLVFSKTAGFRHGSIAAGIAMIQQLGAANDFGVDTTENGSAFTAANLAQYAAVIWLNTTGDVLTATQQSAFRNYVEAGGAWVGIHAATDCEYGWSWYGNLIGGDAWFDSHPAQQTATVEVEDQSHESTSHWPSSFSLFEEWYNFQNNPRGSVNVLMTLDEGSYSGGNMGSDHPIAWYHEVAEGRAWYTALGHRDQTYDDAGFRAHVLGGIQWAAGVGDDPLITCTFSPLSGCMTAGSGSVDVDERKPGKEKLKAVLKKIVAATSQVDFGDPVAGATAYAICLYDQGNQLVGEWLVDRAGDSCGSKPCWKAVSTKGYKYGDKAATADGVHKLQSKSGDAAKGQVQARGKNDASKGRLALPTGIPAMLAGDTQATLQLAASDAQCFTAVLGKVKSADLSRFRASTP
jgi:type 1 glutamine amidotransferase